MTTSFLPYPAGTEYVFAWCPRATCLSAGCAVPSGTAPPEAKALPSPAGTVLPRQFLARLQGTRRVKTLSTDFIAVSENPGNMGCGHPVNCRLIRGGFGDLHHIIPLLRSKNASTHLSIPSHVSETDPDRGVIEFPSDPVRWKRTAYPLCFRGPPVIPQVASH